MTETLTSPKAAPRSAPARTGLPLAPPLSVARRGRRAILLTAGRALMAAGIVAILFVAYELTLSGLAEQRGQAALVTTFKHDIVTTTLDQPTASLAEGSPVALIGIPRVGVSQVVVEGTNPSDLKSGPGHLRATPLPGEFGNAVIAGRRTTYGAPFRDLDRLARGDPINVTTGQGSVVYLVTSVGRIKPGQPDPVVATPDSRLTLVTSDPAYVASGRLVVTAKLKGAPIDLASRPPELVGSGDLGMAGDPLGLGLGLVWTSLLGAALWLASRLRHRWPPVVLYLLTAPVVLALLVLAFSSFDLLLPGTL